jgi:hypothetical protein
MTSQQHFPTVPSSENSSAQEVKEEKKAKVKEEDEKTLASKHGWLHREERKGWRDG